MRLHLLLVSSLSRIASRLLLRAHQRPSAPAAVECRTLWGLAERAAKARLDEAPAAVAGLPALAVSCRLAVLGLLEKWVREVGPAPSRQEWWREEGLRGVRCGLPLGKGWVGGILP